MKSTTHKETPPASRLILNGGGLIETGEPGLLQAAQDQVPTQRRSYRCRFVRAGQVVAADGRPGEVVMTAQALQRAQERRLFDNKAVFVDHPGLWGFPSLHDLVGVTREAVYRPIDGGSAVVEGRIEMYDTPLSNIVAGLLDELLEQGDGAPDVGLSIAFYPVWAPPESQADGNRLIQDIRHIESIDLVFAPAADGRVLEALSVLDAADYYESRQYTLIHTPNQTTQKGEPMENLETHPKKVKPDQPASPGEATTPGAQVEQSGQAVYPALRLAQEYNTATAWLEAIENLGKETIIETSGLPRPARERLREKPIYSIEHLQAAIEDERSYLAALGQDKVVQIGGMPPRSPQITGMRSELERVGLALEALAAGTRPPDGVQPLTGIREAYHLLSGDYEMSGLFHPERVMFANVNSSTMAALVANALNKRLANEFQSYPQWWAPFVSVEDFTSLQDARWITLGGVGDLPTVAEGAAYTELTWDDKTETASFVKKGGYLGLTLEAIDKDDVGRLRAAPRALAQAAWLTLSKAISNIFTSNSGGGPAMSDGVALFHANHANLGSSALSVSTYATARLAMRKQTELNSGERLGALTAPKYILVPPDLEITALQVLASEFDYSYAVSNAPAAPVNAFAEGDGFTARMNAARNRVIVVDLWTDSNDWAAVADPRLYPTIGVGFRYGRIPEIFSVASPTAGLMFSNDTMPIKVRFFFAAGPTDWKGLYKANVA